MVVFPLTGIDVSDIIMPVEALVTELEVSAVGVVNTIEGRIVVDNVEVVSDGVEVASDCVEVSSDNVEVAVDVKVANFAIVPCPKLKSLGDVEDTTSGFVVDEGLTTTVTVACTTFVTVACEVVFCICTVVSCARLVLVVVVKVSPSASTKPIFCADGSADTEKEVILTEETKTCPECQQGRAIAA